MLKAQGVAQFVAVWMLRGVRVSLQRWSAAVHEHKGLQRVARRVAARCGCRSVALAWDGWREALVLIQRALVLKRKAGSRLNRWRLKGMASAWYKWVSEHEEQQVSARFLALSALRHSRWRYRECQRTLRTWKQLLDLIWHNKSVASRICFRWTRQALAHAWTSWYAVHGSRVRIKQLSTRIRRREARRLTSLVCSAWHQECVLRRRWYHQVRYLVCRWSNLRRRRSLDTWQERATHECSLRVEATKVVKRWTHRMQALAWRRWCTVVLSCRVARKALARCFHTERRKSFKTWRAHVASTAARYCRLQAVSSLTLHTLDRRHGQQKQRVLSCWRARVARRCFEAHEEVLRGRRASAASVALQCCRICRLFWPFLRWHCQVQARGVACGKSQLTTYESPSASFLALQRERAEGKARTLRQCLSRAIVVANWNLWCEEVGRGTVRRRCALTATRRCVHRFHVLRRAAWAAWAAGVIRCRVLRRGRVRLVLARLSRVCRAWRQSASESLLLRRKTSLWVRVLLRGVCVRHLQLVFDAFCAYLRRALRLRRVSCRRMQGYMNRFLAAVLDKWAGWRSGKVKRGSAVKSVADAAAQSLKALALRRLRSCVLHVCVPCPFFRPNP